MSITKTRYSNLPIYSLRINKEGQIRYPVDLVVGEYQAAIVMETYLGDRPVEHLAILLLDGLQAMIGISVVTIGGISRMNASVRDVFNHVIGGRASAFILGHNHPSGRTVPSQEDDDFTNNISIAAGVLGIPMLDHIIVSSGPKAAHYSYLQARRLPA